jgi:hypothetical protein
MPSIGQTWVLASIGAVVEMGVLSTLKRLLMESTRPLVPVPLIILLALPPPIETKSCLSLQAQLSKILVCKINPFLISVVTADGQILNTTAAAVSLQELQGSNLSPMLGQVQQTTESPALIVQNNEDSLNNSDSGEVNLVLNNSGSSDLE